MYIGKEKLFIGNKILAMFLTSFLHALLAYKYFGCTEPPTLCSSLSMDNPSFERDGQNALSPNLSAAPTEVLSQLGNAVSDRSLAGQKFYFHVSWHFILSASV